MSAPLSPAEDPSPSVTGGLQTVSYASTGDGRVEMVQGDGWQPVNDVNGQAWQEIERQIARARAKVVSGRVSCLYYYMVAHQMSPLLLARSTRQSLLTVFLHLIPFFFQRIPRDTLQTYADLFQVAPEALSRVDLPPAIPSSSPGHEHEHSA